MLKVNEMFYSLQGEGVWTGTPIIFIRFSGCNHNCFFCDTPHQKFREYSEKEIIDYISECYPCKRVCLTGGEPTLQNIDLLVSLLQKNDYIVHIETNGYREIDVDWITVSPKSLSTEPYNCNELKIIWQHDYEATAKKLIDIWRRYSNIIFIQPAFGQYESVNILRAIDFCLAHPEYRLSLQTQKLVNFK